ncbi:hypothetical protein L7F22_039955 [Adiantum nelumboides]|nr:hypothetical protein [Adiantum nelumboides]
MTLWQILFVVLQVLSNFWLANEVSNTSISEGVLVGIYAALSVASGVFVHLRSEFNVWLGLKASKEFFLGMLHTLFRAPMSFFDSTPTGRILSRVSTDLSILDLDIPFCVGFVIAGSLELLGILVVIAAVTWEILIVAIPMLYIAHRLQHYYVQSGQELMRLNASTKAPIVNLSGEANQGAATIRAFQMVERACAFLAVSDEGENWSSGQRQLFCLGRVLLKESKVLVLDEATASVDSQTDAVLQKVIREEFIDCTVITVAHRIPTVIDSDMVLALCDGKLIEYDKPSRLLEDENSLFARLVKDYWTHVNTAGNNKAA